jgi:hypothetical protein
MMSLKVVFGVFSRTSFVGGRIKDVPPISSQEFFYSGEFKLCYNRMKISEKRIWLTYYILGLI